MTWNSNMFLDLESIDLDFSHIEYKQLNGLTLAFIGDAVYEIIVRKYVLSKGEAGVKDLHKACVDYVNADFQADSVTRLLPLLSEEEEAVYKRGRNAHSAHTPKNKSEAQYHRATGFEALLGYLYLKKDYQRLKELLLLVLCKDESNAQEK